MTTRLRNTLIVSVAVLALINIFILRLNVDHLNERLATALAQYPDLHMQAETTSLTFIHGIGLRLDGVTLDHPDVHITASHINISIRLLPLLLGKMEIKALDLHDATVQLKTKKVSAISIPKLAIERIRLIRSRIQLADGTTLLDKLQLELRGIGSKHEMLWEMSSMQGKQSVSGHGRILFHQGEIESGFSKFKLANLPVDSLHSIAPASVMTWVGGDGNTLTGSLTMDITKQQTWAIFGELILANTEAHMQAKLRGKLSHPSDGLLIWKDSFIHLDDTAVIAIAGSCQQDHCSTTLDAKNIALTQWQPFIPASITFHRHISGRSHLLASLQWDDKTWQSKASLKLKELQFRHHEQIIPLPELNIDLPDLAGDATTWRTKATLTSPKITGMFVINSNREANGDKNMEMIISKAENPLWTPLTNVLLASLNLEPTLQAQGSIHGSLHLHQHGKHKTLELNLNATPAQINYSPWFNKADKVKAVCKATLELNDSQFKAIDLTQCQLGSTHLDSLSWSKKHQSHALAIKNLSLNLDQLRQQSIPLPASLKTLQGDIEGSGTTRWTTRVHWLDKLYGDWELTNIGTDNWQANGMLQVKNGLFSSKKVHVQGIYGNADIQGSYDTAKQQGNINIIRSALDWGTLPALPSALDNITLQGEINQTEFTLLHNNWHNLHSHYKLSQGMLTLQALHSNMAGGSVSSEEITLSPDTKGLAINGKLHAKNIQLAQLTGLDQWLQTTLRGSLQANITLHGRIDQQPTTPWQHTWRHSNGDILIYSGDWMPPKDSVQKTTPYAFKKLEFRFRIGTKNTSISKLNLLSHQQHYQGNASINAELLLTGKVKNKSDNNAYAIDSTLPNIIWKLQ